MNQSSKGWSLVGFPQKADSEARIPAQVAYLEGRKTNKQTPQQENEEVIGKVRQGRQGSQQSELLSPLPLWVTGT